MRQPVRTTVFAFALAVAFAANAGPKEEILATHEAMVKFGRFHSEGTVTTKDGTMPSWSNVVWPDRFHVRNGAQEFVIIPGKTWMKQGGQWMPFPMDMSAMAKSLSPDALRQGYENMTNVKDLGESELGGKTVHGYEYDTQATVMGISAKSHVKLFVDPDTKLPVHQDTDGEAMGQKSSTSLDYTFSDDIDVKAPM
ncbi:MAG TPA: hypothetical protein VFL14_11775 [Xanthomonadales bacterium]|nr:hypothetical protein [Xanthomonadales bacterium]